MPPVSTSPSLRKSETTSAVCVPAIVGRGTTRAERNCVPAGMASNSQWYVEPAPLPPVCASPLAAVNECETTMYSLFMASTECPETTTLNPTWMLRSVPAPRTTAWRQASSSARIFA